MHIVMGGTGHVGSAVVDALLARGEPVAVVSRAQRRPDGWRSEGVEIIEADVGDVASLRAAFRRGRRAFLLNPPADTASDTDAVERGTVANILAALDGSGLEKIVAESTAAAQKGERIGDSNVLWELEEGLRRQPIPAAINRAAYYMSNWDEQLDGIRKTGILHTFFPADFEVPMAAPGDLGKAAADRLVSPVDDVGVRFVEGPERYTPADVAAAFAGALGRTVDVAVVARGDWEAAYRKLGFSPPAAQSYARMTGLALDQGFDWDDRPIRGTTTLEQYVHALVDRA